MSRPVKAAAALRRLASRGKWPALVWQSFLWASGTVGQRPRRRARLQGYVARILATAPEGLFAGVDSAAAEFVKSLAEVYGTDREQELSALWTKAWSGIGADPPEVGVDDLLTDALNHAAGKLAEAALARLWKYEPRTGSGLPAGVRHYFDAIGTDPAGHLGRVMLAQRLHYLFAIDPDWTGQHLIARLGPVNSAEARALWSAYGWSPSVGPDLLQAFKEPFLGMLCDGAALGRRERNLTSLFMAICLESPNSLTAQETRRVVESMSEEALRTTLTSIGNRLTGDGDERARIWREKAQPWLREYWPRAAAKNSSGTSLAMLELIVESGDAFPDAVDWSLPYLRPLEGHGLFRLGRNGQASQFPNSMLEILDAVTDENVLPAHQKHSLLEVLDEMGAAKPALRGEARFQRLYQIATR